MDREDDNFSYGEIYGIQLGRPRGKLPLTVKIILAVVAFIVVIACIGSSTFMPTVAVTLQDASRALAKMGINVTRLADVVSESADVFNPDNVDTVLPADFYTMYNIDKTKLSLERVRAMEAAYIMCTYDDGAADRGASGILLYSQGSDGYDYGSFNLEGDVVYASGTILSRVLDWATAFNYYTAKKTFGTDCSGLMNLCMDYVDIKTGSSYKSSLGTNTDSMMGSTLFETIDYNNLAPGDILAKRSGDVGHTVMFLGWEDKANKRAYTAAAHGKITSTSPDNMAKSVDIRAESINYMKYFHGMEIGGYTPSNVPGASGVQFQLSSDNTYYRCYLPNMTYRELGGYSDEVDYVKDDANEGCRTTTVDSYLKSSLDKRVGEQFTWENSITEYQRNGKHTLLTKKLQGKTVGTENGLEYVEVGGERYYPITLSDYFNQSSLLSAIGVTFSAISDYGIVCNVNLSDGTTVKCFMMDAIGIAHSCVDGRWTDDKPASECQDKIKWHCVPMTHPEYERIFHALGLHVIEGWTTDKSYFNNYINLFTKGGTTYIVSIDITNKVI